MVMIVCLGVEWQADGQGRDTLRIMFWNLENFFDNRNDSTSVSDAEFSSYGERHWSRRKFHAKCQAIAKSILWTAGEKGGLPDVIGVAEVENKRVLRRLLYNTLLHKLDYKIVHFESPDPRGIDVALFYRSSRLKLSHAKPCRLYRADSTLLRTRDILLAEFIRQDGAPIAFLVNHHPSKYGGASVSEPKRQIAIDRLRQLADSLQAAGTEQIVAMGDFNDTPISYTRHALAQRLTDCFKQSGRGIGLSYNQKGFWVRIDHILCSSHFTPYNCEIDSKIDFSDHYPVVCSLKMKDK